MPRQFKILDPDYVDWLFIDNHAGSKRYISYCHVIEHALLYLLAEGESVVECKKLFKDFKSAFDEELNYPLHTGSRMPLRLYWLRDRGDNGHAVLVDDTEWCFPLVMDNTKRATGLKKSVNDVYFYIDKILMKLEKYASNDNEWDEELQRQMNQFNRNKKKKAV